MKIAVCDDEEIITEQIKKLILQQGGRDQIDTFLSADSLFAQGNQYDVYYLDICMDGTDGMAAAKKIRESQGEAVIVFVTSEKEYLLDAFGVEAAHYLLKPIDPVHFRESYERAKKAMSRRNERETLFIHTGFDHVRIPMKDILYAESQLKNVIIHTVREQIIVHTPMTEIAEYFGNGFYPCHRSYMVNYAYVTSYSSEELTLSNGEKIPLSRRRYSDFVKGYMHYLKEGGVSVVK